MATTAKGTPYVESSDLVADYPTVSLALAEHIDDLPQKIVQVVRATDTTLRSLSGTTLVDMGFSITITPTSDTSNILILWSGLLGTNGFAIDTIIKITDSSNNPISGAENSAQYLTSINAYLITNIFAWASPATTSAVTYKLRWQEYGGNEARVNNPSNTGQLFAIEVSA
jgi:hypothetical protein